MESCVQKEFNDLQKKEKLYVFLENLCNLFSMFFIIIDFLIISKEGFFTKPLAICTIFLIISIISSSLFSMEKGNLKKEKERFYQNVKNFEFLNIMSYMANNIDFDKMNQNQNQNKKQHNNYQHNPSTFGNNNSYKSSKSENTTYAKHTTQNEKTNVKQNQSYVQKNWVSKHELKSEFNLLGFYKEVPTIEEVKDRYKKLIFKFHPDRYDGDPNKAIEINEAYQMIKDFFDKEESK